MYVPRATPSLQPTVRAQPLATKTILPPWSIHVMERGRPSAAPLALWEPHRISVRWVVDLLEVDNVNTPMQRLEQVFVTLALRNQVPIAIVTRMRVVRPCVVHPLVLSAAASLELSKLQRCAVEPPIAVAPPVEPHLVATLAP